MIEPSQAPTLFFDGHCHLCARSVQFILRHEQEPKIIFVPLQSAYAQEVLASAFEVLPDSLIFWEGAKFHTHSGAALRLSTYLSRPWSWLRFTWLIPRFLRDAVYRYVAKNRYRWYGQSEECWLPKPEWRSRFRD